MPDILKKRLAVDTLTKNNDRFNLDGVISFTAYNFGSTDCQVGYTGQGYMMTIAAGQGREFTGHAGTEFYGEMEVKFVGATTGQLEIIKSITDTTES